MNLIFEIIIYLFIGTFAGFLSGLLGIGGGLIVVPSLLVLFHFLGFPPENVMKMAIATSLAAMVFTVGSSAWAHRKGIIWHLFKSLVFGILLGAILGATIASIMPEKYLQIFFGFFVCLFGLYFLLTANIKEIEGQLRPHFLVMTLIGLLIGAISSILGIGGGIITVPLLTIFGTPMRNAISTSAATGFVIAVASALSFFYLGLSQSNALSLGYIYIPAFIVIGLTASLLAPLGAKHAYSTSIVILKRVFGFFQIIVGILLIYF